ncbi:MAG: hypothetical protein ACRDPO_20300 [Streptosporangiaceae bacterium]
MDVTSETEEHGVRRIEFTIPRPDPVPGILWVPAGSIGPRPLVLLGHGGAMHKEAPGVLGLSRALTRGPGYAATRPSPSTCRCTATASRSRSAA